MTKDQIKALIASKIAGQGTAVDVAGALASILDGIIDLIPAEFTLPVASAETLGGVKVGENLSITEEGVLSVQGAANIITLPNTTNWSEPNSWEVIPQLREALANGTIYNTWICSENLEQRSHVVSYGPHGMPGEFVFGVVVVIAGSPVLKSIVDD